jgi:alpha-amylase
VWPLNRNDMPWGARDVLPGKGVKRDEDLRAYYRRLIDLRRSHPALSRGAFRRLSSDGDLLVFERSDAETGSHVVVAVNRGGQPSSAVVDAPAAWGGTAVEAITGAAAPIDAGKLVVSVPPRQARVFVSNGERPATGT